MQCRSADDSDFGDYTQLMTPETQAINDSVNECNIQRAMTYHEQGAEMGGVSRNLRDKISACYLQQRKHFVVSTVHSPKGL
jgi:hypothetical protein